MPSKIQEPGNAGHFGLMGVIDTDQGAGRKYVCACGWEGWSAWGHARRHAEGCPRSGEVPDGFRLKGQS